MNKKFWLVFLICFVSINVCTLLFPIKLYDGEVLYLSGITEKQNLSLSFLVNKAKFLLDYPQVKDIYLNKIGWTLVVCINIALPLMIAVRSIIPKRKQNDNK
jgi:hypothetical protein